MTVKKGIYGNMIGMIHSLQHGASTIIALLPLAFFIPLSIPTLLILTVAEIAIHYHIDYVKTHYGTKDNTTAAFWQQFGMDQLLHQATYIAMTYLLVA